MWSTVQKLHEKPMHVRKRYAVGVSFGITLLIAIVWVTSFSARISEGTLVKDSNSTEDKKPLAAVVESVQSGVDDFKVFFDGQ